MGICWNGWNAYQEKMAKIITDYFKWISSDAAISCYNLQQLQAAVLALAFLL